MGEVQHNTAARFTEPVPFTLQAQGHDLQLLPTGADRLDALLGLIREARESLRMAFYIYSPDASGCRVRDALVAAAERGVRVQLVLDSFGANVDEAFFAPLTAAGGTFCCFMPRWNARYLIRNHQKIVVADGARAMLGGFNIEDSYFAAPGPDSWTDLGFIITGPVVARVATWFDQLESWATNPHSPLRSIRRLVRKWHGGDGAVQLLIGGPTRGLSSWARHLGDHLRHARRLDMMMAYFSPPPNLSRRIGRIARRGQARLVLAGRSDNPATMGASRAFYTGMLNAGVDLWEYQASMLHTKLIVVDDCVYLGSANFDMRSLYLNLEIVLSIHDADLAERMRSLIGDYLPASEHITPQLHRSRAGWLNRLIWLASWFLVGVVDYTVSRRLNLGQRI